jgi:hypothetical protein
VRDVQGNSALLQALQSPLILTYGHASLGPVRLFLDLKSQLQASVEWPLTRVAQTPRDLSRQEEALKKF